MKVRMKTIMAGPGGNAAPGQVIDVDEATGRAYIDGGFAEAVTLTEAVLASDRSASAALMGLFMGLTKKVLLSIAEEREVEVDSKWNKGQIAEALVAAGIEPTDDEEDEGEPEIETASLGGGERAARTEQPKPRERTAPSE